MQKQVTEENPSQKIKALTNDYICKDIVADFSSVPEEAKLSILQHVPGKFINTRTLQGKEFKYIDHNYAKKCLNFIFNFNVSSEIMSKEYFTYTEKYSQRQQNGSYKEAMRDVTEAECEIKFTFTRAGGKEIVRTVCSSHKGYKNPSLTRGDIMQSALSKAWTKAAQTFGIGANFDPAVEEQPETEEAEVTVVEKPQKSFNNLPY